LLHSTFQFWRCAVSSSFLCNTSCCTACCWIFPLETLPHGDPKGVVIYLRIVLSPEKASRIYISVFGKRLSRKSNNGVVFPFAFHIAVQQPLNHPGHACCCTILNHLKRFESLLMTLRPASEEFYRSSPLQGNSLRLVPTLSTCLAWGTLLVAMQPA